MSHKRGHEQQQQMQYQQQQQQQQQMQQQQEQQQRQRPVKKRREDAFSDAELENMSLEDLLKVSGNPAVDKRINELHLRIFGPADKPLALKVKDLEMAPIIHKLRGFENTEIGEELMYCITYGLHIPAGYDGHDENTSMIRGSFNTVDGFLSKTRKYNSETRDFEEYTGEPELDVRVLYSERKALIKAFPQLKEDIEKCFYGYLLDAIFHNMISEDGEPIIDTVNKRLAADGEPTLTMEQIQEGAASSDSSRIKQALYEILMVDKVKALNMPSWMKHFYGPVRPSRFIGILEGTEPLSYYDRDLHVDNDIEILDSQDCTKGYKMLKKIVQKDVRLTPSDRKILSEFVNHHIKTTYFI